MLTVLRRISAVAKEKLFPAPEKAPDKREPHQRFEEFAQTIVNVPKEVVEEREKIWQAEREKKKRR